MPRFRPSVLQDFLDKTSRAMLVAASIDHRARAAIEKTFTSLNRVGHQSTETAGARLPICVHFDSACRAARRHSMEIAAVTDALCALEPRLSWTRRIGAETCADHFLENHANARIIGEGGLELSDEVGIGVSLMAPHTIYPNHHHPPEEVYIALSPGEWRQGAGEWRAPGTGGLIHNRPNILHSMRSTEYPLLAIWCLQLAA
jgi:hypothetical protein